MLIAERNGVSLLKPFPWKGCVQVRVVGLCLEIRRKPQTPDNRNMGM